MWRTPDKFYKISLRSKYKKYELVEQMIRAYFDYNYKTYNLIHSLYLETFWEVLISKVFEYVNKGNILTLN